MAKQHTFTGLLRDAARLQAKLAGYDSPRSSPLSADAFVTEALKNADTNHTKLDALEAKLSEDKTPACFRSLRAIERFVTDTRFGACSRPPRNGQRLGFLGRDSATAELLGLNSNFMELFALGVRNAARRTPEKFGDVVDTDAHDRESEKLKTDLAALKQHLATAWRPDDLTIAPVGTGGLCRVTFAVTRGGVDVFPTETCADRAIAWALQTNFS